MEQVTPQRYQGYVKSEFLKAANTDAGLNLETNRFPGARLALEITDKGET